VATSIGPWTPLDRAGLVVHGEAVDHRRAGLVQADDLDLGALAAELQHHLVQRADGGDVPEVRAADVDAHVVDHLLEVEGGEALEEAKNTWPDTV
jgi:hypothetical protein